MLERRALLRTGFAGLGQSTGQRWDRGQLGTPPECPPHARFDPIDLLVPRFVECLRSWHLISPGGRGGRFRLGLRTAGGCTTAGLCALTAGVPRAGGGATDGSAGAARGLGTCTARGRGCRADGNFIETVGEGPRVITHKGVDRLPDGPVRRQDFLKGRASKGAVGRHGHGQTTETCR